jgi:hypothetical protein
MFSFFRKKPKQANLPPQRPFTLLENFQSSPQDYQAEISELESVYGKNFIASLSSNQLVQLIVSFREMKQENEAALERNRKESNENVQQLMKRMAFNEQAEQKKEQNLLNRNAQRERRLNNIMKQYGYKSRKNLQNNAAKQRGEWRARNPMANYMSIENFANSTLFHPHLDYTGTTNNNANTLSVNSAYTTRSGSPYSAFGGRAATRRRSRSRKSRSSS